MSRPTVGTVENSVAVGIGRERIGAGYKFVVITQAVAVLIANRRFIGRLRVANVKSLPIIGQAVLVFVFVRKWVEHAIDLGDVAYAVAVEIGGIGIGRGLGMDDQAAEKERRSTGDLIGQRRVLAGFDRGQVLPLGG